MKKISLKNIICIIILIALIVGCYVYWSPTKTKNEVLAQKEKKTQFELLLNKDLDLAYPATPREVIRLYSKMIKCFYNEDLSQEQINQLMNEFRKLFDEELLKENKLDAHTGSLQNEIKDYKKQKMTLTSYIIEYDSKVKYKTIQDTEYATILAYYQLSQKSKKLRTYEQFVLRKDKNDKWKILGWKAINPVEIKGDS